ncbi:hypothetical protein BCU25_022415 [Vibrio cyclitrophicus]
MEVAQAGVSGLATPALVAPAAKKHVAKPSAHKGNVFDDWVSAKVECGVGGQSNRWVASARARQATLGWMTSPKPATASSGQRHLKMAG